MRNLIRITLLFMCGTALIAAQSGELIHTAAEQTPFTVVSSAQLIAAAVGTTLPGDAEDLSIEDVQALGYRVPRRRPDQAVTKGQFALLLMQFFDYRGGLRYELLATPAAAFRELQDDGIFTAWELPGEELSGAEALEVVSFVLQLDRAEER